MKNSINVMSNVSRQGLYIRSLDILSGEVIATSNELQALDVANQVKHSYVVHQFTLDVKKDIVATDFLLKFTVCVAQSYLPFQPAVNEERVMILPVFLCSRKFWPSEP